MNLIILGPQGCGKGTQAKLIAQKYHLVHLSSGDLLRSAVNSDSSLGQSIKTILDRGDLVPFADLAKLLEPKINAASSGFILDGTPRNLEQAEYLDNLFTKNNIKVDKVIFLDIPDGEALKRLEKRAKLENRSDDTPEVINKRLAIYHQETEPVISYYQNQGLLLRIDGTPAIETIFADIQSKLN